MKSGFTLIEILVSLTIFGVLSIAVVSALNPIEQINRGRDSSLLNIASNFYQATDRLQANNKPAPWPNNLSAEPLSSDIGQATLQNIIDAQELKASFLTSHHNRFDELLLTTSTDFETKIICFLPKSKAYRDHQLAHYDQQGQDNQNCNHKDPCYICLTSSDQLLPKPTPEEPEPTPVPEETDSYPHYPWSCVSSDKYEDIGCNNFCTHDLGCVSPCEDGQRRLVKFYGHSGPGPTECLEHHEETKEYYCVSDPHARCELTDGGKSWVDHFYWNWTLSAPIRWREPDEPVPVWKPFTSWF